MLSPPQSSPTVPTGQLLSAAAGRTNDPSPSLSDVTGPGLSSPCEDRRLRRHQTDACRHQEGLQFLWRRKVGSEFGIDHFADPQTSLPQRCV